MIRIHSNQLTFEEKEIEFTKNDDAHRIFYSMNKESYGGEENKIWPS